MKGFEFSVSPLQRIAELEKQIEVLLRDRIDIPASGIEMHGAPSKSVWQGGENLLLYCLKRMPVVLDAYRQDADLQINQLGRVEIKLMPRKSMFKFVELDCGDAVLLLSEKLIDYFNSRASEFCELFEFPQCLDGEMTLDSIIRLPYFMPVERGARWLLSHRGLLGVSPKAQEYVSAQQIRDRQQNRLLGDLTRMLQEHSREMADLKSDLRVMKNQLREIVHLSRSVSGEPFQE